MALLSGGASPHSPARYVEYPRWGAGGATRHWRRLVVLPQKGLLGFRLALPWSNVSTPNLPQATNKGLVSKETVVLRRLGREHKTLDLSTELIRWIGHHKEIESDVSSVSPSSGWIKELWVALGLYGERWSYAIGRNTATWKTRIY